MTVDELIAQLQRFRGDLRVVGEDDQGEYDPKPVHAGDGVLRITAFAMADLPIPPDLLRVPLHPLGAAETVTYANFSRLFDQRDEIDAHIEFADGHKVQGRIVPEPLLSALLAAVERVGVEGVVGLLREGR